MPLSCATLERRSWPCIDPKMFLSQSHGRGPAHPHRPLLPPFTSVKLEWGYWQGRRAASLCVLGEVPSSPLSHPRQSQPHTSRSRKCPQAPHLSLPDSRACVGTVSPGQVPHPFRPAKSQPLAASGRKNVWGRKREQVSQSRRGAGRDAGT